MSSGIRALDQAPLEVWTLHEAAPALGLSTTHLAEYANGKIKSPGGHPFPKPHLTTNAGIRIYDAAQLRQWRTRTVKARRKARIL